MYDVGETLCDDPFYAVCSLRILLRVLMYSLDLKHYTQTNTYILVVGCTIHVFQVLGELYGNVKSYNPTIPYMNCIVCIQFGPFSTRIEGRISCSKES